MKIKDAFIIDQPREVLADMEWEANLDNDPDYLAWMKKMDEQFKKDFYLKEIKQDSPAF